MSPIDLLSAAVLSVESVCSGDVRLCSEHRVSDRCDHAGERVSDGEDTVAEAASKNKHSSSLEAECAAVICSDTLHHLLVSVDCQWCRLYVFAVGSLSGITKRLLSILAVPGGHVPSNGLLILLAKSTENIPPKAAAACHAGEFSRRTTETSQTIGSHAYC